MTGTIRYRILPEIGLIIVCVVGDIKPDKLSQFLQEITSDPLFDSVYDNITDFSFGNLEMDQNELLTFAEFFKSIEAYNGHRREAYIVKTSSELAKLSIFSIYARYSPVEFNVVTSIREAMEFIGVKLEHSQIVEETITALRNL